jgi:hypothetical protein
MRTKALSIFALAALIIAAVVVISPHAWTVAHKATGDSVDTLGLTMKAKDLPVQQFVAF